MLPTKERRELIDKFELRLFDADEMIIRENELSEQIYLIKHGTAAVFTEKGGPRVHLSEISAGALFGEMADLRKIPRTASVVAKTPVEALVLSGQTFTRVVAAKPGLKARVFEVVARRARENMDKVMGPSPFAPKK